MLARTRPWREERARALMERDSTWHTQRALGLLARETTVRECGTQAAAVGYCADCGKVHVQARRCGDRHVCGACASWAGKKTWARVVPAVERMLRDARREWNARGRISRQRPIVRMLTLTTRDTGDMVADRETLQRGWGRHRAWLDRRANPRYNKVIGLPRARLRFVRVWEVTKGTHGLGHVHCHVVTVLGWYSYKDAREAWSKHTDGESSQYDVTTGRTGGRQKEQAANAGRYLAKYISKGADVESELGEVKGAEWWIASYARRALSAHRGAWLVRNAHCGDCGSTSMSWTPAKGDVDAITREATGPPVPWVEPQHFAAYALADLARVVGSA